MLTNILLGLILMTMIIIICGKYSTILELKAILIRITSIQEILQDVETSKMLKDIRDNSKHCNPVPCSEKACVGIKEEIIQDCLSKEAEYNPVVKEQIKQINPKHKHTQEQLNILIKLAGKELTDEQVKIYFSKATNTLVYRYEDVCVKKEYHGKDFLNYTLLKHNRVIRVLYKEDLKEFDKVLFKQEIKEEKIVPEVSEYKEKVKDFMNLKRSTMLPDESLLKRTSLSRKMLHRYATEDELKELKELRKTCQSIGIGKIKKRGLRGSL